MALLVCTGCTARYSVGAPRCPECGSTEHTEEGAEDMAKVTVHGGPSDAAADEAEAGEGVSAGSSSSTSSEKDSSSPETSEQPLPSRARGTANRSKPGRKAAESSTAEATDTSGPETAAADES